MELLLLYPQFLELVLDAQPHVDEVVATCDHIVALLDALLEGLAASLVYAGGYAVGPAGVEDLVDGVLLVLRGEVTDVAEARREVGGADIGAVHALH